MFLSAVSHFSHPVTEIPLPLFRVHEDELRALHEIGAKPLGPTFGDPKSRSKRSRYSSENDVLIEKSVKYTDFFLLSIVYV